MNWEYSIRGGLLYYNHESVSFIFFDCVLLESQLNTFWTQFMFITKVFDLWENMFLNHFLVIGLVSEVISSYTDQMKIKDNKCTSSNLNLFDF